MERLGQSLKSNVHIMKARVTKYAVYGVIIAFMAILAATLLNSYLQSGEISLAGILKAQKTNATLWILDAMPFIFAFWGQYVSSIMAYEASTMVIDQTNELRSQTAALEYQASHDATHDQLTDLPNRILLRDRLDQAIHVGLREENRKIALFILDLDRFKEVNDTLGHYNGDRLLKHVALRLKGTVRGSDTLARLGGDEFAILLPLIKENHDVLVVLKKIQQAFTSPFTLEGLKLDVQASMGVAIFPDHGRDVDTIMQRADVAMYAAKQDNQGYAIYSTDLDKHSPHRLTLMGELRQAIDNDELRLHFQPKINVKTNSVTGVEALVRWQHPQHGFMPPDEFIPLAERTGLIKQLSLWVLKRAIEQAVSWHRANIQLSVAINLSPSTLLDTELPDVITGALASCSLAPRYITFEITEGSIIKDPERALEILTRLAAMGTYISIDDFGTGYSSLAYLKRMPASEVKIDKSFVLDMLSNENDAAIVRATIDLAHNLGLQVVAEGVENKKTAMRLKELGCDILQGYYFSKPLSAEEFSAWMKSYRAL
ncbi:MAG: EAL domain-containing protein [Deltaproteobacteria bacterium]|nr:EAL domain-containing protein [Deltaproteobacteria bacterium]